MRYLFADCTPFPLPQNFLATICAGTDACVTILRADDLVNECAALVLEAEERASRELAQIAGVATRMEGAFGADEVTPPSVRPVRGTVTPRTGERVSEIVLARIREQALATMEQARSEVVAQKDARIAASIAKAPRSHLLPALSTFLSSYELPETAWGIRWNAATSTSETYAELYARTPFGLDGKFDLRIPHEHCFARAPALGLLGIDATIALTQKPWLRKARPTAVPLTDLFVTQVTLTPERASLRLSSHARKPSHGIEFVFTGESSQIVTATRVDKAGYPLADGERLGSSDSAVLHQVWATVTTHIGQLVAYRTRMTAATLGGVQVGEIPRPEVVAHAIIRALAPYVREIARRTPTPRELALKRELGDGCREELFIGYDTVLERIGVLEPNRRPAFDAFGLATARAEVRSDPPPANVWKLPVVKPPRIRAAKAG
jgi:hypothetical protein